MKGLTLLFAVFSFQVGFSQLQFQERATDLGANFNYGTSTFGGGVSFVDFDNDGWDDLSYSSDETKKLHFLKNNSGIFSNITLQGVNHVGRAKQVLWVDYDNDGDKDLFVATIVGQNKLYENNGSMIFTDITASSGLFTNDLSTYGAAFGDIDNDGDLDLMLCNRESNVNNRNYLYRNDNGTFVDITQSAGINMASELSFCSSMFDYDNDGDQDIYLVNDKYSYMNRLYRNNSDGTFTDVSDISGTGISIDAMSGTISDYNNDGWFDIYVTNSDLGNQLLHNNGDGTFTNKASETGTEFFSFAWGAVFLDADNDTSLDLYVSGVLDGSSSMLSAAFYHNDGNQNYTIPPNIGFGTDTEKSYSNAIGDINNNGKPDIVVMNHESDYFLWENQTNTTNNWIKIKLEGVVSNKDGIGNRIEIHANGQSQYRYTLCGEGYLGQNSNYEFVGISDATNIDYIKVTWNKTGVVETINNIQPNQAITIQEGNGVLSTTNEELQGFSIYPNPSADGVYQINGKKSSIMKVSVFDFQGKHLLNELTTDNQINLSVLSNGIYILKIRIGDKTLIHKVIKN